MNRGDEHQVQQSKKRDALETTTTKNVQKNIPLGMLSAVMLPKLQLYSIKPTGCL